MPHSVEKCFGKRSDHKSVKRGLGVPLRIRAEAVKQFNKSKNKLKKDLKALKKQNKTIYSISKKSGSRCELKRIKKIKAKASKKRCDSIINYSSDTSYSDSSLSSNSN